jgi:flagellar basal-body rod protein FlgG
LGVQIAGTERDTTPGKLEASHGELHLAIVGCGYFQIQDGAEALYTRAGAFALNSDGEIVLASSRRSRLLEPAIAIPADATNVEISDEGIVSVRQPGSSSLTTVGQIQLARFVNPAGLEPRGENLLAATNASGAPQLGSPSLEGRGKLRQRCLETSNVNLDDELAELQRLQSRLVALEKARSLLTSATLPATANPARIAESIAR